MADILHNLPIFASKEKVVEAISTPSGLDKWWTKSSSGKVALGEQFNLRFEPNYNWTAVVSKCSDNEFELTMQASDKDWEGSKVGFILTEKNGYIEVDFYHIGWKDSNRHFNISNFCWAMYLRILKRYIEFDEVVEYADRLNV